MKTSSDRTVSRRRFWIWIGIGFASCGLLLASDMIFGAQYASAVIGGGPENSESVMRYPEGGVQIGKWQIVRPPIQYELLGYQVEELGDGRLYPIGVNKVWNEDGDLIRDFKAFDADGKEVAFYPLDADQSDLDTLKPHAKVVMYDYSDDGRVSSEHTWIDGVPQVQ